MEGQRERTSSRRRQRRKSKTARGKITVEPVLIVARRPDSPLLKNGFHTVIASAEPKRSRRSSVYLSEAFASGSGELGNDVQTRGDVTVRGDVHVRNEDAEEGSSAPSLNGAASEASEDENNAAEASAVLDVSPIANGHAAAEPDGAERPANGGARVDVRRRAARIVKATEHAAALDNREQRLLDRLMRSQGRVAISRAANELWESKFKAPRQQEVQIQLLEHENEHRARDAVFVMAELLQKESPIQRPILDQRLRRLEEFAEDPITRDAARALRRSMRVHHGM
jgi:hypothetical protein